jgi:cell division protein FtsW (lipid II flippase)
MLPLGILLAAIGVIVAVLQRDLGTMIVIAAIFTGLIFLSNVPMKQMLVLGSSVVSVGVLFIVLFPHRIARFLTFLDPTSDVQGAGYHIHQALIAIGSGGWTGLGLVVVFRSTAICQRRPTILFSQYGPRNLDWLAL